MKTQPSDNLGTTKAGLIDLLKQGKIEYREGSHLSCFDLEVLKDGIEIRISYSVVEVYEPVSTQKVRFPCRKDGTFNLLGVIKRVTAIEDTLQAERDERKACLENDSQMIERFESRSGLKVDKRNELHTMYAYFSGDQDRSAKVTKPISDDLHDVVLTFSNLTSAQVGELLRKMEIVTPTRY